MKGHDLAHGHTWLVGIVGLAVGTVLLFVFPSLKAVSGAILLVALLHVVGGLVVLASLYAFAPRRFASGRQATGEGIEIINELRLRLVMVG
jgi:hypothetical protein